ncbi:MAG TPA: YggS family pyridoxal phosphate-dependent enzyme [Actinobacteria bacterium]|nr:YggS family pyridoxal phosphate-dependent enzyme [Actinomycetota bacterium]
MIAERLAEVRRRIAEAAARAGRNPEAITLVAVSKGMSDDAVLAAHRAGQRVFGENRPEALARRLAGPLPDDLEWHLVGHVQRRKAKLALGAAMIESLDRLRLAETFVRLGVPLPPMLVEVNLAREPQKHGFDPDDLDEALDRLVDLGLSIRGLMAIPPRPRRPEDSRPWFAMLADLAERLRSAHPELTELSMGMTDDFEIAIEEGATIVRVGRAIFGPRPGVDEAPPAR